jgi:hypothetical protein
MAPNALVSVRRFTRSFRGAGLFLGGRAGHNTNQRWHRGIDWRRRRRDGVYNRQRCSVRSTNRRTAWDRWLTSLSPEGTLHRINGLENPRDPQSRVQVNRKRSKRGIWWMLIEGVTDVKPSRTVPEKVVLRWVCVRNKPAVIDSVARKAGWDIISLVMANISSAAKRVPIESNPLCGWECCARNQPKVPQWDLLEKEKTRRGL